MSCHMLVYIKYHVLMSRGDATPEMFAFSNGWIKPTAYLVSSDSRAFRARVLEGDAKFAVF